MTFALVDYRKGNIKSVERALAACGADVVVTSDADVVRTAHAVVLPGVGAFADAMGTLRELGLDAAVREAVGAGVPFLGICLGLHLMFEGGTEHAGADVPTPGLGIVPGVVDVMPRMSGGVAYKVPHVGWNSVRFCEEDPLFAGIPQDEHFYFTHSYIAPASDFTTGETTHSVTFPSVVRRGNAFGVQFHPEKSSGAGARLIGNFVEFAQRSVRTDCED